MQTKRLLILLFCLLVVALGYWLFWSIERASAHSPVSRVAITRLKFLSTRIEAYARERGKLPPNFQELKMFLGSNIPPHLIRDPWGNEHSSPARKANEKAYYYINRTCANTRRILETTGLTAT